jgi:Protein of unknown function (DUF2510)
MDVPAGWYPDPATPGLLRYWMGTTWSESTQPAPVPAAFSPPVGAPVITSVARSVRAPSMAPAAPPELASRLTDDVYLPAPMIEWGDLPCVCVRHGRPAVQMPTAKVYSRSPIWVYPIMLLTLLAGLIVALAIRVTVAGMWPACEKCVANHRRNRLSMWACIVAVPSLIALGIWLDSGFLAIVGFLLAPLGAMVFGSFSSWTQVTKASVNRQSHAVHVRRPAIGFVAALPTHSRVPVAAAPFRS